MAISVNEYLSGMVKKVIFSYTALTTGTTSGSTSYYYDGEVIRVIASNTKVESGVIALKDDDGNDLLMGLGTLTTGVTYFEPTTGGALNLGGISNSKLTLEHTIYPTTGSGYVYVYIR